MTDHPAYPVVLQVVLFLLEFVVPPFLAARKGYGWYAFLLNSILGLLLLASLPFCNQPEQSLEEQEKLKKEGNFLGYFVTILMFGVKLFWHFCS